MRSTAVVAVTCALAVSLAATGCRGQAPDPPTAPPSPKRTVLIDDGGYQPARVQIRAGGRVTWVNRGQSAQTVETDGVAFFELDREKLDVENRFDLHTLQPGEAESVAFDTPGRYEYHSSFDSEMKGTVVVAPSMEHVVEITDSGYEPAHLRIEVGDHVTFVNRAKEAPQSAKDIRRGYVDPSPGDGPTDHSGVAIATAYKRGFSTHALFPGEPQTVVFGVAQRYVYTSSFNEDMRGVIEVVEAAE